MNADDPANEVAGTAVIVMNNVTFSVDIHPSRTSAVVRFTDDRSEEHRVSLIAQLGGGAATTFLPKGYVAAVAALGVHLWPKSSDHAKKTLARTTPPSHRVRKSG